MRVQPLRTLYEGLSLRQRLTIGAAAVLVITSLLFFLRWNRERNFKPLYTSLSAEDAGAVIAKLRESGVEYRLSEGGAAVLVPSQKVAELRLQMATAGIPKSGRIGFELFDRANLGTTDFAEQVNYHRAIEGELERSVMAMAGVEQARVHITLAKDSVFTDNRLPSKASVMVKLKPGVQLSSQNVAAIAQLASSAVEGLSAESVSIMDMRGNLLMRPKKPGDGSEPSEALLAYKQQLEKDALGKINSVLDPLLGSAKYQASVDLDCDLTSGEQSEELFDPSHSVITTSQRTEEGSLTRDAGGVPGTQTNLPRPTVRPLAVGGGVARRSENMAYQTSRSVKRLRLPQGAVRRMSISVLVDHDLRWEAPGQGATSPRKIIQAPSPEKLRVIHDVVAAAAGFNASRGDLLTVEALPFEATLNAAPPASMTNPGAPDGWRRLLDWRYLAASLLLLCIAGSAFYFIKMKRVRQVTVASAALAEPDSTSPAMELTGVGSDTPDSKDEKTVAGQPEDGNATGQADTGGLKQIEGAREAFQLPPMMASKTEFLTRQLVEEAKKDPVALAQIVRSWLNEKEPEEQKVQEA